MSHCIGKRSADMIAYRYVTVLDTTVLQEATLYFGRTQSKFKVIINEREREKKEQMVLQSSESMKVLNFLK